MLMILVDTSVWIDHLDVKNGVLVQLLEDNAVLGHRWVTGELAIGNPRDRVSVINLLNALPQATLAFDEEILQFIETHQLYGKGIGYIDAGLITATKLTLGALLWTNDKRLARLAAQLRIDYQPPAENHFSSGVIP
jgi:predicted nucleic acid-binding protein